MHPCKRYCAQRVMCYLMIGRTVGRQPTISELGDMWPITHNNVCDRTHLIETHLLQMFLLFVYILTILNCVIILHFSCDI